MILYPAIDLRDGRVVRLTQGDFDRMDVYDDNPIQVARRFLAAGATHLHVVDLDGARTGQPRNAEMIRLIAAIDGLFVQTGGGIRDAAGVEAALSRGVNRVILGTVAIRDRAFVERMIERYGEAIAVGVDARAGKVAVGGWLEDTAEDAFTFCRNMRDIGVKTIIYTDIERDGGMAGANQSAYERLLRINGLSIIASGGVHTEAEIAALRSMGVHGAIVGKALYTGALDLTGALRTAAGEVSA